EQEERSTFANVLDIVGSVLEAGEWELDDGMTETFTRIFFGAMSSAGEAVSTSDDPIAAARRVEAAITFILAGMQALAESGAELPSVTSD
ncbi:MAG: TetR/AcrR family transcriptional regulator, partial [Nocardioides sp.]